MLKSVPDNVTILDIVSPYNIPVDRVLNAAVAEELQSVTIVGTDSEGNFYFATSYTDGPQCLWDLQLGQKKLLEIACPS